jgi:hypothetical protein
LWCSKEVSEKRARARGDADIDERIAAWQATVVDRGPFVEPQFTLTIRTDVILPATAASLIQLAMGGR